MVEGLSEEGVTILVLHDFDKSGLSILHTLRSDTRRFKYRRKPRVVDIGLRLRDVRSEGLSGEPVSYSSAADPKENLRASGATEKECAFLVTGAAGGVWQGRRAELNELTSPQFVAFVERKLIAAGVRKVVPADEALAAAYRLQVKRARVQEAINAAVAVPENLREKVAGMIEGRPMTWDKALWEIAGGGERP